MEPVITPINEIMKKRLHQFLDNFNAEIGKECERIKKDMENLENVIKSNKVD